MIPASIKNYPYMVGLIPVYLIVLFLAGSSAFAEVEIKNYFDPYKQIKAVCASTDDGFFVANGAGIFILDTVSGNMTDVEFENPSKAIVPDRIFQFGDEVFCYISWGSTLFKYVDGKFSRVTDGIVDHCYNDSLLVLVRKEEPWIITYKDGYVNGHLLGDGEGTYNFSHFTELNGTIYGLMHLNYTANMFIFSASYESLTMIVSPGMENYSTVNSYFPAGIVAGPDRIWLYSYKGYFYLEDNLPVSLEVEYGLDSLERIVYNEGYIFGLRNSRVFSIDMQTKEVEYLTGYFGDEEKNTKVFYSDEAIYMHVYSSENSRLFRIDKATNEFTEIKFSSEATISQFQTSDDEMIMVRGDILEIYRGTEPPKIFGEKGMKSNTFFNLCRHPVSGDLVALTISDFHVYLTYINDDTTYYEETPVPFEHDDYLNIAFGLEIASNGDIYISVDDQFWIKDSFGWEQHGFWKYQDNEVIWRRAEYNVITRDSNDAVWLLAETCEELLDSSFVTWLCVYKIKGDELHKMYEIAESQDITFDQGICLANGDVVWATTFDKLYYFKNGEELVLSTEFEDCDDDPHVNSHRRLFARPDGTMLALLWPASGYDLINYYEYYLDPGAIVFDGENWDKEAYSDLFDDLSYEPDYNATYLCDSDGNEYFINKNRYVVLTKDKAMKKFEFDGFARNGLYIEDMLTTGNTFWVSTDDLGLFRVTMPDPIDVREPESDEHNELCREVVSGNTVRLNYEVDEYQVYSSAGVVVAVGGSSRAVDVSQLNPGVYFIRARTMTDNYYGKFIRL